MRKNTTSSRLLGIAVVLALPVMPAWAQEPSGTLTGRVTDADGYELPGVQVTAHSPALLGERTALSGADGEYRLASLPPGTYRVSYELEGFATQIETLEISAEQATVADVSSQLAEVVEDIVVVSCGDWPPDPFAWLTFDGVEELPIRSTLSRMELVAGE